MGGPIILSALCQAGKEKYYVISLIVWTLKNNTHELIYKTKTDSEISIITLNVNGLTAPIKRHRVANWIKSNNFQSAAHKNFTLGHRALID